MDRKTEQAISRIQQLQQAFSKHLAGHIEELCLSAENLDLHLPLQTKNNQENLHTTCALAHKLAGSAGTFQFTEVYTLAKKIEQLCYRLIDTPSTFPDAWADDWLQLQQLLNEIKQTSTSRQSPVIFQPPPSPDADNNDSVNVVESNKIILVDDDELLASLIQEQARHFGYSINCINNPEELSRFLDKETPEIILMDIVFPNHAFNGIDLIKQLKAADKIPCPVIFLSNREDFDARLEAVRAGGNGYIVKPVNILELVEILDRHLHKNSNENYHALVITHNTAVTHYYETILAPHKITCKTVSHLSTITEELILFSPDIILLDNNLQNCSGFEITRVIRQDNRFTHIPILLLMGDANDTSRIEALKAGSNCFVDSNTPTDTLITAIICHSQRSKELHAVINRLRKDELRFQTVSHSSTDAIITLNKDGLIIFWNEGAENIFGYQSLEVIGQPIDIIIPAEHQKQHRQGFTKLLENSAQLQHRSIETRAITKNKKIISIELTYTEWLSGNERFFTSIIRDTTHRKEIENELHNQQENLKAIVNNSAEGIITINDRGVIEMANPKAQEIFSYSADELKGQNISILMPGEMRQQHEQYLNHSEIHAPKIINKARELQGLRKDGSVFPMELNVSPMMLNGVKKYVGILHDITERKNALATITAAKLEAENANQAKSQFLSSMSHELRTPLNAILGFTQLLQEDSQAPLNEDQKESLAHIYSAGRHLLTLIDEVLDLSKIESGNINVNIETVNLIQLLKESIELITPQARRAQIKLLAQLPDEETILVKADAFRLNQVFSNLLTNAIKYNHVFGQVTVWLSTTENKVRIFVKDTGAGIPEEMMKDLFKPFSRLGAEQSDIEGTGIGLTITKMLVEMMNGSIGVDNQAGKGCTFWIEIEMAQPLPTIPTSTAPLKKSRKPEYIPQKSAINILYIEDNPANRLLMKKIISSHSDFQYTEAVNGKEGLQAAFKLRPQIVLLDINLPDMNGLEVFKQLQKNNLTKTTKVIVVSANAMPADIAKAKAIGFFDYVTKPIEQEKLLSILNNALSQG